MLDFIPRSPAGPNGAGGSQGAQPLEGQVILGHAKSKERGVWALSNTPFQFDAKVSGDLQSHLREADRAGELNRSPVLQGLIGALATREGKPKLLLLTGVIIEAPDGSASSLQFSAHEKGLFVRSETDENIYHPATLNNKKPEPDLSVRIPVAGAKKQDAPSAVALLSDMARNERGAGYARELKRGLETVEGKRHEEGGWDVSIVRDGIKAIVAKNGALADFVGRLDGDGPSRFAEACTTFENIKKSSAEILAAQLKAEGKLVRA